MARGWIHTVHKNGQWVNEIEGGGVLSSYTTKEQAVEAGRVAAMSNKAEHVIHNMDGTIAQRNSYGPDSYPPRG